MRPVGHAVLDIDIPAFDESTVEIQIDAARTPNTPSRLALAGQPLFRQLGGSRAGQCREGGSKNKGDELRSHGALPQGCRRTHEPRAVIIARRLAVERLFFTRFDSGGLFSGPTSWTRDGSHWRWPSSGRSLSLHGGWVSRLFLTAPDSDWSPRAPVTS